MVSSKAVQALVISLFMIIVLVGLFFLLRSQLASLLEEMEGNKALQHTEITTTFTPASLVPATLTAMNQVLAATVESAASPTLPAPTMAPTTTAARMGIVNSDMINVRSYPDLAGEVVAQVREGERLEILATSTDGEWLRVCCPLGTNEGDRQSWIAAEFVTLDPAVNNTPAQTIAAPSIQLVGTPAAPASNTGGTVTGTINSSGVNLRSGPGTAYAVVGQAQEQTAIELTGRDVATLWWQICCPPGAPSMSWISAEFVVISMPKEQALTLVPVVTAAATSLATPTASAP